LFLCDTPEGATASARLYSLIETAKANHVNPYEYLKALFEKLPHAETDQQLKNLLPQYFKPNTSESV
jgi:transposase